MKTACLLDSVRMTDFTRGEISQWESTFFKCNQCDNLLTPFNSKEARESFTLKRVDRFHHFFQLTWVKYFHVDDNWTDKQGSSQSVHVRTGKLLKNR